jgi:hypothetical protein
MKYTPVSPGEDYVFGRCTACEDEVWIDERAIPAEDNHGHHETEVDDCGLHHPRSRLEGA